MSHAAFFYFILRFQYEYCVPRSTKDVSDFYGNGILTWKWVIYKERNGRNCNNKQCFIDYFLLGEVFYGDVPL